MWGPIWKIIKAKKDWWCGSSDRVLISQAWGHEFKTKGKESGKKGKTPVKNMNIDECLISNLAWSSYSPKKSHMGLTLSINKTAHDTPSLIVRDRKRSNI
jgi:hypothetical protein